MQTGPDAAELEFSPPLSPPFPSSPLNLSASMLTRASPREMAAVSPKTRHPPRHLRLVVAEG